MASQNKTTALIKLNGTIVKKDGSEEPSNYFKFLELQPDDYGDVAFTPEEAQKVRRHLQHLSTGATAAIPMICGGAACCPFASRCPYVKIDKERRMAREAEKNSMDIRLRDPEYDKPVTPVGRSCLVEINLLNEWTSLYLQQFQVDPHHFSEFQMVRELSEIELMLWRLNNNLAKPENAELVQETTVGVDKAGNALTRKEVNAIFEAKERLQNRKSKLIKLMVGDRQEQWKKEAALKQKTESDPSISAARLRSEMDRLLNQAKNLDTKLKEATGQIIEVEADTLNPEDLFGGTRGEER